MKKLFCRLGLHWLEGHVSNFIDRVSGKPVFSAKCSCGKEWMTDSLFPLCGCRVEKDKESDTKEK